MAIAYYSEDKDANDTRKLVEAEGRRCLVLKGDVGDKHTCVEWVNSTVKEFGRLDVLVNNAAVQQYSDNVCSHVSLLLSPYLFHSLTFLYSLRPLRRSRSCARSGPTSSATCSSPRRPCPI